MKRLILAAIVAVIVSGCSSTKPMISAGMGKDQVEQLWGSPIAVKNWENSCCWEKGQEAWHYYPTKYHKDRSRKSVVFEDNRVKYVFIYRS